MQHIKVSFEGGANTDSDVLMAMLAGAGYDGFEEADGGVLWAYIEASRFSEGELTTIATTLGTAYTTEVIPSQNWNALWESNFQPVVVDEFCTIRAHFHDIVIATPYEIIITPKMSFGTGHHATTQLMITLMKDILLEGKTVIDFGTGTGVLAIMAELLGAKKVLAIDNDPWCIENAIENAERNNCKRITVQIGSLDDIPGEHAEVVLANINRHILLHYMVALYETVNNGGILLLSGLLVEDESIITDAAIAQGFYCVSVEEQSGWIAMLFEKP